jgi:hypothetical protein
MRFVDTLGRVERFQQKQKAASGQTLIKKKDKKLMKKLEEARQDENKPRSLKEMLEKAKQDSKGSN